MTPYAFENLSFQIRRYDLINRSPRARVPNPVNKDH